MLETLITGAMILALLFLTVLVLGGERNLRRAALASGRAPGGWPRVALIIPVTGDPPGLSERLTSLLTQDYPDCQVIFAIGDAADPATRAIRVLMAQYPRTRLVIAGPARGCGQKNHNLLAALKLVGVETKVLAFCDSNQLARASWLKELVRPIALGETEVVSGYHHIRPGDSRLATCTRAATVMVMFLAKSFPRFNQSWGGATAIHRRLFRSLEVEKLWAENVVDDVSLAARLVRAGIRVRLPEGPSLATPLAGESFASLSRWLTRQWLYLKFCLPATWLVSGLITILILVLTGLAAGRALLALAGLLPLAPALPGIIFLAALMILGLALRRGHPQPGPRLRWLATAAALPAVAAWAHFRTWFTPYLDWRDFRYRVTWGGRVKGIERK